MMKYKTKTIVVFLVYAISLILLLIIFLAGRIYDIPFEALTGDPANYHMFHPLTGILSNIGIILWSSTAAICLFTCVLIKNHDENAKITEFYLYSGALSFILLLDDFFMLHDRLLWQRPLYLLYLLLILYFFYRYHSIIKLNNKNSYQ